MSNARSPRDVCSTTIGTSGLIVLASFTCSAGFLPTLATASCGPDGSRLFRTGRPELPGFATLLARCPDLLARPRLFNADGLGLANQQVERLAVGQLIPNALEAIGFAELLEQLLDAFPSTRGCRLESFTHLVVGGRDALGLHHRGQHCLPPQGCFRSRLGLVRKRL